MRIKSVHIKNFRSFDDERIDLDPYTCFVGPNGAGKSTVLNALNIFFGESTSATPVDALSAEDFHQKRTDQPIEITLTFSDLSTAAQEALKDYYRNGELIVSAIAEFDEDKGKATVQQFGERMGIAEFAPFFRAFNDGRSAAELQEKFDQLKLDHPGIPNPAGRSKEAKRDALRSYESDPTNAHMLTPLRSDDHFYGIAGPSKLRPFLQWVYVPAVKDATDEQSESRDGAFGKLLARTVHARVNFRTSLIEIQEAAQTRYQELMDANQGVLDEVAATLSQRLSQWSHPDVDLKINWNSQPINVKAPMAKVRAGEQGFEGDLARFGHGFQRSYLLALLQELASLPGDEAPLLLLGVEEPELYQHPPQARYLSQVLQQLAGQDAQVLITTHSPCFVGGYSFETIRLFQKDPEKHSTGVLSLTHERFADRYADADEDRPLQPSAVEAQLNEALRGTLNEMFFSNRVVFVEGTEDAAYLMTWIALTERLPRFRSLGIHIVPVEGKRNLAKPLIIAQELGIPTFVVFDGDRAKSDDTRHITDNKRLLRVLGFTGQELFPQEPRWGEGFVQWPDDFSKLVDAELSASLGPDGFQEIMDEARQKCGFGPTPGKHTMFIQSKLSAAAARHATCETLETLCNRILGEATT